MRLFVALTLTFALIIIGSYFCLSTPFVNQDVALNIVTAQKMASATLYSDWIDNNPPAIYFISQLCLWVTTSRKSAAMAFYLIFIAFCGLIRFCLASTKEPETKIDTALNSFVVLYSMMGCMVDAEEIGQRDHLFAVALIPILLNRTPAIRSLSYIYYFILGYLSSLKPQFMLIAGCILAVRSYPPRSMPVLKVLTLISGSLLPMALLAWHSTESVRALISHILPLHLSGFFAPYSRIFTTTSAPLAIRTTALSLVLVATAAAALHRRSALKRDIILLGSFVGLGMFSLVSQWKYWSYHYYPLQVIMTAAIVVLIRSMAATHNFEFNHGFPVKERWGLVLLAPQILAIAYTFCFMNKSPEHNFLKRRPNLKKILTVSSSATIVHSYFFSSIEPVGRWIINYPLPFAWSQNDAEERDKLLATEAADLQRHIDADMPDAIYFAPYIQAFPDPHDFEPMVYGIIGPHLDLRKFECNPYLDTSPDYWIVCDRKNSED